MFKLTNFEGAKNCNVFVYRYRRRLSSLSASLTRKQPIVNLHQLKRSLHCKGIYANFLAQCNRHRVEVFCHR